MSLKRLMLNLLLTTYECHMVRHNHMFVASGVLIINWSDYTIYSYTIELLLAGHMRLEHIC